MDEAESIFNELAPHATETELLCGRGSVPGWPSPEGWRDFLLSLDDQVLCDCERLGLHRHTAAWRDDMPEALRALCDAVRRASLSLRGRRAADMHPGAACCCSPDGASGSSAGRDGGHLSRRQKESKADQVQALTSLIVSHLGAQADTAVSRVVDVGCGRGHLTAELSRQLGVPALGIDRDAGLLDSARTLYPSADFEMVDVAAGQLASLLRQGDLVVGLHPCGLLGERIVEAVASTRGLALLMVPCCLHKQGGQPRPPRSALGKAARLTLPCAALKKASMASDASATVAPRRARHALRALLLARGVDEAELLACNEMDGVQVGTDPRRDSRLPAPYRLLRCSRRVRQRGLGFLASHAAHTLPSIILLIPQAPAATNLILPHF
jgi:SAM-dependent methyltransferase